ncbi:hypothetical protein GUJ93_ZPchr0007g6152 [Zizania palustris]|uniref:Uncharacterized protein n=1 Tax=Zizania palustris TaxID=103762 RepID=A0A8J5VZY5_ZIZPA|nr:hypothetical protein GUJ93_ZPchr0007g6152 [Zizania palustris]
MYSFFFSTCGHSALNYPYSRRTKPLNSLFDGPYIIHEHAKPSKPQKLQSKTVQSVQESLTISLTCSKSSWWIKTIYQQWK